MDAIFLCNCMTPFTKLCCKFGDLIAIAKKRFLTESGLSVSSLSTPSPLSKVHPFFRLFIFLDLRYGNMLQTVI